MYLIGFDKYLKTIENNPNYLYAGYSAGICVLAADVAPGTVLTLLQYCLERQNLLLLA